MQRLVGQFSAQELSQWLQQPLPPALAAETWFSGLSTDSRTIKPGQLFLALKGEHMDGHHYLAQAQAQGAIAAVVSDDSLITDLPLIRVQHTGQALLDMAAGYRQLFNPAVISLTGSAGKTTCKEMLAHMLATVGPVLATAGNLNNEIGVPLTLLRLDASHAFAVIEQGANHRGEIAKTTKVALPRVALLLNAMDAHLGEFGSRQAIIEAKSEIFSQLKPDDTAIVPLDNPGFEYWQTLLANQRVATFSLRNPSALYYCDQIELGAQSSQAQFHYPGGQCRLQLPLPGEHNLYNAVAALASAHCLGLAPESLVQSLADIQPMAGRLQCLQLGAVRLIDDSYNASPQSVRAAIDVLSMQPGYRVLVLADMAELGDEAQALHAELGEYARSKIDALFTLGTDSAASSEAFGQGALHFESQDQIQGVLQTMRNPGLVVLIKGSHKSGIFRLAQSLQTLWSQT